MKTNESQSQIQFIDCYWQKYIIQLNVVLSYFLSFLLEHIADQAKFLAGFVFVDTCKTKTMGGCSGGWESFVRPAPDDYSYLQLICWLQSH